MRIIGIWIKNVLKEILKLIFGYHCTDNPFSAGLLHFSSDYTNGVTGVQYQSTFQGLLKSEWRAVYRENLIRGQAGVPLRTNYGIDMSTGTALPAGPRLLDATNQPLNYK